MLSNNNHDFKCFLIKQNEGMIPEYVSKRVTKLAALKQTNQPYLIIVGTAKDINKTYVRINDKMYQMSTVLNGIDTLFKTFYALNIQYPFACRNVWLFIQEYFFKLPNIAEGKCKQKKVSSIVYLIKKLNSM